MNQIYYDLIYIVSSGINGTKPEQSLLDKIDLQKLFQLSKSHLLDAIVGMTLKSAGISLSDSWNNSILNAIRKNILFDNERSKLYDFMEQNQIWYLPLKGILMKDYYPELGMRQMSDNDILFDRDAYKKIRKHMISQGYACDVVGGCHDAYKKKPVFNFELHRSLYDSFFREQWYEYYKNIKSKLLRNKNSSYGYHFRDEDFYIYSVSHTYKHYDSSGTGLRSLLDLYVYLKAKHKQLDFAYIEKECRVLGIEDFEKNSRNLCKKIFSGTKKYDMESFNQNLSEEEHTMLEEYLFYGVYGTLEKTIKKRIQKENKSRFCYLISRVFPGIDFYRQHFPFFYKYKVLLPIGWLYRIFRMLLDRNRVSRIIKEIEVIKKT